MTETPGARVLVYLITLLSPSLSIPIQIPSVAQATSRSCDQSEAPLCALAPDSAAMYRVMLESVLTILLIFTRPELVLGTDEADLPENHHERDKLTNQQKARLSLQNTGMWSEIAPAISVRFSCTRA